MNTSLIFSLISAAVTLGGVFIAIGVFKGKINENYETNIAQGEQIKNLASKDELSVSVKRADEMLAIMQKRTEEDRAKGQGQWREFHGILTDHTSRLSVLEKEAAIGMKLLEELKRDIKQGLVQLHDEFKEAKGVK